MLDLQIIKLPSNDVDHIVEDTAATINTLFVHLAGEYQLSGGNVQHGGCVDVACCVTTPHYHDLPVNTDCAEIPEICRG